jgi:gas vesicle protein
MSTASKVTLGILGAAAAGVVIGLLIAPEKGSEMRKRVQKTASGWADDLTNLFNDGKDALNDLKDKAMNVKGQAEDKAGKMKESFS